MDGYHGYLLFYFQVQNMRHVLHSRGLNLPAKKACLKANPLVLSVPQTIPPVHRPMNLPSCSSFIEFCHSLMHGMVFALGRSRRRFRRGCDNYLAEMQKATNTKNRVFEFKFSKVVVVNDRTTYEDIS